MSKLTKREQELYDEFKILCDKLADKHQGISIGNKFRAEGRVWLTYKRSGKRTNWAYVYPDQYRINTFYDCNLWGFTLESQETIVNFLRSKLNNYEDRN